MRVEKCFSRLIRKTNNLTLCIDVHEQTKLSGAYCTDEDKLFFAASADTANIAMLKKKFPKNTIVLLGTSYNK